MKNVLIISADGFEDTELLYPLYRLREAGVQVDVASFQRGMIRGKRDYQVQANISIEDVVPDRYDALVLPGGRAPRLLKNKKRVQEIAAYFFETNKTVAAICHGPLILAAAGLLKGRSATCYGPSRDELVVAGAKYLDCEVVVDGNLITSRVPTDLPAFSRALMMQLESVSP